MLKYITFRYDTYYPGGGLSDAEATFDQLAEAVAYIEMQAYRRDHEYVVDRDSWAVVWDNEGHTGPLSLARRG